MKERSQTTLDRFDLCGESLLEAIAQIDLARKIGTYEKPIVWVAYAA